MPVHEDRLEVRSSAPLLASTAEVAAAEPTHFYCQHYPQHDCQLVADRRCRRPVMDCETEIDLQLV